jgi:hypothetical protein
MKKIILTITILFSLLFGWLPFASAVMIYTEDWGNANTTVRANGTLNLVGWTAVAQSQTAQPYLGIYGATGANDPVLGLGLPPNTVYFTGLTSGGSQTNGAGMFYTINGAGTGSAGDSAFTSIDPTLYPNLTFNVEVRNGGGSLTNYFAVQVGGVWYAATQNQMPVFNGTYPTFTNWAMAYTTSASAWNIVTVNSTYVTLDAQPGSSLSGPITGIGIVELNNTNVTGGGVGFNYNNIVINQGLSDFPQTPPTNTAAAITPQYVYVGGGASFVPSFAGAPTLKYFWETNGVVVTGARYVGAQTSTLTITNVNLNDANPTYSVVVTNFFGSATNGGLNLIVSPVPAGLLYAETFPYVGPNGNLPLTGVGWQAVAPGGAFGIYSAGPGLGDVFSYSASATTNAYFTTVTNDTGLSGLPFVAVNPASYPAITFQANFTPGNAAGQVTGAIKVYWAVQMGGSTWYASAQPVGISLQAQNNYLTNQYAFNPAVTNWNNLTIDPVNTFVTIGSQAAGPLAGNITGAGLIFVHNATGADINFQDFAIITNAVSILAPTIDPYEPLNQSVSSGGGASFGVSATGTQPFTYSWTINGNPVSDGGRISGSTTPTFTIANLTASDNNLQVVANVSNNVGSDNSASVFPPAFASVTNAPVGLIYSELFPFVGPVAGNYPISNVGWVEAVSGAPNALYRVGTTGSAGSSSFSAGAVFAYSGVPATTVYYATTATDTNQAGLPFPDIDIAAYGNPSSLNFSVDIAPSSSSSNVTAYIAVQVGTNWYVSATPLPVPTASDSPTFSTYTMAFNPTAANWNNLTVSTSGGIIGAPAAGNLKGVMTGAGLVFVYVGSGGNFNFSNFIITGTGVGGINIGSLAGGNIPLTWVGNPAVKLQSTTSLSVPNWQDVPNTYGLYSLPVSVSGPQQFYRLKTP